jgi:hypothetical protein
VGLTLDERHGDERHGIVGHAVALARRKQRNDVGMVEPGREPDLLPEALAADRMGQLMLDGVGAAEASLQGFAQVRNGANRFGDDGM